MRVRLPGRATSILLLGLALLALPATGRAGWPHRRGPATATAVAVPVAAPAMAAPTWAVAVPVAAPAVMVYSIPRPVVVGYALVPATAAPATVPAPALAAQVQQPSGLAAGVREALLPRLRALRDGGVRDGNLIFYQYIPPMLGRRPTLPEIGEIVALINGVLTEPPTDRAGQPDGGGAGAGTTIRAGSVVIQAETVQVITRDPAPQPPPAPPVRPVPPQPQPQPKPPAEEEPGIDATGPVQLAPGAQAPADPATAPPPTP
jgi:hypothetical protein